MDIAVLSDIHGNYSALQACFDYCMGKGITHFLLLGDYVTDCPDPQKTMKLIYVMDQYFDTKMVRGNREEYLLSYRKRGGGSLANGSASGSLLYTYENLSNQDFDFFSALPVSGIWKEKGFPDFTYCHGSPEATDEILLRDKRSTRRVLSRLKNHLLVHGHYHLQESYNYRDRRSVNPGSVGLPWSFGGKTQFAILHGDGNGWEDERIQLEYDREEILSDFQKSSLMERAPAWCALTMHTIRTGRDLSETVLLQAMQFCMEDTGSCFWPDVPEKYWAKALKMNGIDLNGRDMKRKG